MIRHHHLIAAGAVLLRPDLRGAMPANSEGRRPGRLVPIPTVQLKIAGLRIGLRPSGGRQLRAALSMSRRSRSGGHAPKINSSRVNLSRFVGRALPELEQSLRRADPHKQCCAVMRHQRHWEIGSLRIQMGRKVPLAAFRDIPTFLEQGLSIAEIASRIGCTVGTLRVKCSKLGISLSRWNIDRAQEGGRNHAWRGTFHGRRVSREETAERTWNDRSSNSGQQVQLRLPRNVLRHIQQRAALKGVSDVQLLALLIEVIDRDDLYNAVLDGQERD